MAEPWEIVSQKEEYRSLGADEREQARLEYFNQNVLPQIPVQDRVTAQDEFLTWARKKDFKEETPSFMGKIVAEAWKGAKRAAGIGIGVMNSPLAFVWGSQAAPHVDPEEWDKMPLWKQTLVSAGGGFESAWRSATKEGDWGTLYGDYFKAVTGKTIEEELPDKAKVFAPTIEFMANLISDPLFVTSTARSLAKFDVPKNFSKIFPSDVQADLGKIAALEQADKTALVQRMSNVLKGREDYMRWWETNIFDNWKRQQQASTAGLPKDYPSGRWDDIIFANEEERKIYWKDQAVADRPMEPLVGKPPSVMRPEIQEGPQVALQKESFPQFMGEQRFPQEMPSGTPEVITKGAPYVEPPPPSPMPLLRAEGRGGAGVGKPAITLKSVAGAGLGIEEDDDGNISYNVIRGLEGTALAAGAIRIAPSAKRFAQTLAQNPNWAAVHDMVGDSGKSFSLTGAFSRIMPTLFDRFSVLRKVSPEAYDEARKFNAFKDVSAQKFDELKDYLQPVRDSEALFTDYVTANRAVNRAQNGIRNPKGVTEQQATDAIMEMEAKWSQSGRNVQELRDTKDMFNEWANTHIVEEAKSSGMISDDLYQKVMAKNQFYATFEVLDHMPDDIHNLPAMPSKEYFSVANQNVIKKMKGTEKEILNPIEATVKKFTQAQGVFAKNRVASALIDDPATQGMFRPVADSPKEFGIMTNRGQNPIMRGNWAKKEFDTVTRFKDGIGETYLVPKDIADTMMQLTPYQAPRAIQYLNQVFRSTATTLYAPFTISNAFRDGLMAYVATPHVKPWSLPKLAVEWGKGAYQGAKHEFGFTSNIVDDYLKHGGGFGYVGSLRDASRAKADLFKKGIIGTTADIITSPIKLIEKISATIELAPRLAVFETAKMAGYSADDAAMAARQSTIDFNRGGTWTKVANQWVPFLNARVQGGYNLASALKNDTKNTLTKIGVAVVLPGVATYAWNRMYHSKLYDDIPDYIKNNYFVIITGVGKDKKGNKAPQYMVIPKGDVGQLAWNPLEFALDKAWTKDQTTVSKFLVNFLSDISPIQWADQRGNVSPSKAAGGLMPPVVKGFAEDWAGKNLYTGMPIVPRSLEQSPPELQAKEDTPSTYKALGKRLGMSPLRIQNFMGNILAGYGREGLDPDAMMRGLTGRFMKTQGGQKEQQAWEIVKDVEQGYIYTRKFSEELVKNGNREAAVKLMNDWDASLMPQIQELSKLGEEFADKGGMALRNRFTPDKRKTILMMPRDVSPLNKKLYRGRPPARELEE